jgi:predicted GTPase
VHLDDPEALRGHRVLVVEYGPTITHGGLPHGAGYVAATAGGAAEIVDPRHSVAPEIEAIYARYPHIGPVLPAVGYHSEQIEGLRHTIERSRADVVLVATPIDLAAMLQLSKPTVRAYYEYADAGEPTLGGIIDEFLTYHGLVR